ncbi:hypothetical protein AB1Y20_007597 [Prymnesium parvum]|uniref:Uncharacterized protein n=1 Tax=Prymnesium parvum TaxID=97485 RepID=A0AB34IY06_PRYPA
MRCDLMFLGSLNVWHHTAIAAFTTAGSIREPADHESYSPGKRPDLYLPALNLALDVKTGSLFTSSATKAAAALAAHTPLAATAETFLLRAFGDPRVASKGEYSRALAAGTSVNLLITEITGARHRQAERFLRTCASAHAERYPRADDSDGAEPSFYARASALLSAACLRGLGDELRSRVLSSVSRASLRRLASALLAFRPLLR